MYKPSYKTHACVICGCEIFTECECKYTALPHALGVVEHCHVLPTRLEACTLCGTVRDKNIVNKRYKEKHHESTDER